MDRQSQVSHTESTQDSTHLIPTRVIDPKRPRPYDPIIMNIWVCLATAALMMGLGIALEVALRISYTNGGFKVPRENVITFVSQQFLLSFFPTLFVIPLAFMWREIDWMISLTSSFLEEGQPPKNHSFLTIALGAGLTLFRALKYKHRIVFFSALTAAATYIFQPLAGSIFQIRQLPQTDYSSVTSTKSIGLKQDVDQLNDFVAAAGFAEAAVAQNLTDPPFVQKGWATAEFIFPPIPGLNGSMTVNTTGVQSKVNCFNPTAFNLELTSSNNFTITATSLDGCPGRVNFDPSTANQQYGVIAVRCPNASSSPSFQPVMFWFFHRKADSTPEAKSVFCTPSIQLFNVRAVANLNNGSLYGVTMLDTYTTPNNVTGPPLNGQAFNGVVFDLPDSADSFVRARATAVNSGVSGSIFRLASQKSGGLQGQFDLPNGFLDLTSQVYTQHLSITAKSIYFVGNNIQLPSALTSYLPRLWIDPLPGHALACILFLVGFVGVIIHILGRRARRNLNLCAPPGSIAAIMALTSRSGFGELLLPYDDEKTLERKLSGLRFCLDRRTGAIVADEYGSEGMVLGRDDALQSLLGQGHERHGYDRESSTSTLTSSSQLAAQAATGYPPWVLKTPYDHP